jgi:hypothetical protein
MDVSAKQRPSYHLACEPFAVRSGFAQRHLNSSNYKFSQPIINFVVNDEVNSVCRAVVFDAVLAVEDFFEINLDAFAFD